MARVLMCRPDYYGIRYEINPWMRTSRNADPQQARVQWESLYHTLSRRLDVQVELVAPAADWPDMVFTANAGLVVGPSPAEGPTGGGGDEGGGSGGEGSRFILSNFRHPQRAGEACLFWKWFTEHEYTCIALPPKRLFEGEGDALWAGATLLAGYRFRSDLDSHRLIADLLGCRVISLELADNRFYHLDTCLAPLSEGCAIWHPPAFDDYGRRALAEVFTDLIELDPAEALRFAANAVVVGRSVVINTGCPKLTAELTRRGYEVFDVDLSEFIKAGGAAKCLVLFLEK